MNVLLLRPALTLILLALVTYVDCGLVGRLLKSDLTEAIFDLPLYLDAEVDF